MTGWDDIRVEEVDRFLKLDFNRTSEFQVLVDLAAKLCGTPVAILSILGKEHNYLKVRSGVDFEVMPRETSFCQYAIEQDGLFVVPDACEDSRFSSNPLVHSDPGVRFYAGAPLVLSNGAKLGTLCLFDVKPNNLTELQQNILSLLSRQAISFMELELGRQELKRQIQEKEEKNQSLVKIAQLQSHQIRQPLTSIMGLVNLVKNGHQEVDAEWLVLFEKATDNFDSIIQTIVAETFAEKDLKAIRFYKMVEEIEDYAILLLDKEGYIENWNRGAKIIKGYKSREVIGKHFSIFYTDDDRINNRPKQLIELAEKNGIAKDEGWRVRKDGGKFWGSIVITAIHDNNKNVVGFTKVTRDLTDITDLRESLKASAELNEYLAEQTNNVCRVGGWEFDLLKNELTWTSITKQIHGVNSDYVPDVDNAIKFYKEGYSRSKISEVVTEAIVKGKPWDIELQLIDQQGKELWVRTTGRSNFKGGTCTKVYGTCQDIDVSKNTELQSLRLEKFKDVLDAATEVSMIATDLDGLITVFNTGAEKMLGYKSDEVIGQLNFSSFYSADEIVQRGLELTDEYDCVVDGFEVFIKKAQNEGIEQRRWTVKRKDGYEKCTMLTITLMRDADGIIIGYLGISSNSTEKN